MKALAKNLVLFAFISGSLVALAYYAQQLSNAPIISVEQQPSVTVEPEKSAKTLKIESRYQHCLQTADQNRANAWEISCEQTFPATAVRYNACVTNLVLKGKAASAAQACQSKCMLPETISGQLDLKRDQSKALCRSQMQAAEQD